MQELLWIEGQHDYESLAVALRALLATRKMDRPYEELIALLGLGGVAVAARGETLGWWSAYGRDVRLEPVARRYGIRLRALHPPDASVGLPDSAEFATHFRDSYVPLIERALEHDQPVLAWRGWPPQRDRLWGVITQRQGPMLIGYSLWHGGQILPLTGPAHQVYVVEGFDTPHLDASADALFADVVQQAVDAWDGHWARQPNLVTGQPVYGAWQDELRNPSPALEHPLHKQQALLARTIVSARRALATWLRSIAGDLTGDNILRAAAWASACDRVADLLAPQASDEAVRSAIDKHGGVELLCDAIHQAECVESEAIAELRRD